jgi:hypothetical protein
LGESELSDDLPALIGSAFSDLLSAFDLKAAGLSGSAVGLVLSKILNARAEKAREIALEEIRYCERPIRDAAEADEFVSIT